MIKISAVYNHECEFTMLLLSQIKWSLLTLVHKTFVLAAHFGSLVALLWTSSVRPLEMVTFHWFMTAFKKLTTTGSWHSTYIFLWSIHQEILSRKLFLLRNNQAIYIYLLSYYSWYLLVVWPIETVLIRDPYFLDFFLVSLVMQGLFFSIIP